MSDPDPLRLIRCDWGHKIGAADSQPCPKDATRRVALHLGPEDVDGTTFKFCDEHLEVVSANTDERTGPVVDPGALPEVASAIRLGEELLEMDPPAEVAAEVRELMEGLRKLQVRE